ncbi:hypothetical protein HDU78_004392 [Chytriomyces hyalinus]|nr:hypothetical protein HDU78_004392 [Chytriomyces hyalinus]
MASTRAYDIVLFGATGFTGKFATEYLLKSGPMSVKFAIAGRSRAKLEAVRTDIAATLTGERAERAKNIPILIADSNDQESLDAVAASTKVILTTVGPFLQYGKPLADACIRFRTDYIDSTGETPYIKNLIDAYEDEAIANNVRIVPSCGFDSLPSDLGTLMMANHFAKKGKKLASVRAVVVKMKGGISGGTIHSAAHMIETTPLTTLVKAENAYALNSKDDPATRPPASPVLFQYNKDVSRYELLWPMESGNAAYVRRSWGLLGRNYGAQFRYSESLGIFGSVIPAVFALFGTLGMLLSMVFPPSRWVVKKIFPQGQGPSPEMLKNGCVEMKFVATSEDGEKAVGVIKSHIDIGYVGTGLMLAEAAMCLALDDAVFAKAREEDVSVFGVKKGGILTAATAMSFVLVERLKKAGMEFYIEQ